MQAKVSWTSNGNQQFAFEVLPMNGDWNETAGLYMFCKLDALGVWRPQYIGQTSSFKARFSPHDKWSPAVKLGATHVLAMVVLAQIERDRLEDILIGELHPPLNTQLRQPVGIIAAAQRGFSPQPQLPLGGLFSLASTFNAPRQSPIGTKSLASLAAGLGAMQPKSQVANFSLASMVAELGVKQAAPIAAALSLAAHFAVSNKASTSR